MRFKKPKRPKPEPGQIWETILGWEIMLTGKIGVALKGIVKDGRIEVVFPRQLKKFTNKKFNEWMRER